MKKLFLLLMAVMLTAFCAVAQNKTVSGTVVSAEDGEPLTGAAVHAEGTTLGVVTDLDGRFSLSVPASVSKLRVSFVGYETQSVDAGTNITVSLKSTTQLDEVMVVAYGTAKKSEYTGSASVVKADQIEGTLVTNAVNALTGRVAGVQIQSANGQPGASPTVRVRGVGSINASSAPLYVLDGMPFDGDVSQINTMDIESMTVLKDAAAAALYGARGANGVILITTKKGKSGDARITFDARWGVNSRQVTNYDVIESPAQYYEMGFQALQTGYLRSMSPTAARNQALGALNTAFGAGYRIWNVPEGEDLIGTNGKLNPYATLGWSDGRNYFTPDNWSDESFRNGLRQEYSLSVSGGNDKLNFYVSASYLGDEGVVIGSNYNRLSTRTAVDYQAKKWLKIGTSLSYNYVKSGWPDDQTTTNSGSNAFLMANTIAPIYPMYIRNADGSIMMDQTYNKAVYDYGDGRHSRGVRNFYQGDNAISQLIYNTRDYLMDIFNGKWYATLTPVENLNVTGTVGYYLNNRRRHEVGNNVYGQLMEYGGIAEQEQYRFRGLNLQALATYRHTVNDVHNLDYLLGYESYDYNTEYILARGYTLYQPGLWVVNNTLNNDRRKGYGGSDTYATRGIFGRVNYNYDGKYYFSASYRRDASSRFRPGKRWGNFFSLSAAWDMAKESFMNDFTNVDMIKIKASFGQQGNDGILDPDGYQNYYPYLDQYSITGTDSWADGNLAIKGNRDITWETSNALNVGADFSFFQGRVAGTLEYFQRQTSDMLYNKPTPPSLGYSSIPMNVGSMRNYGMELELNVRPIETKDLVWEVNLNATWIRNKVLKLSPDLQGKLIRGITLYEEGKSRYQYYLVEYAGVDKETGSPLFWSKKDKLDANGNKIAIEWKKNPDGTYELDKDGNKIPTAFEQEEYKTTNYDEANAKNRKATGNNLPWLYGGFGTSLNYKGFDFSINFSYQLGGHVLDTGYASLMHSGGASDLGRNWHTDMLNAWTPENTNTNIPKLDNQATYNLSKNNSTFMMTKSDYLALNNITVGYTLPSSLTNKIGIESIRVYAAGDNLALWCARKGLDPRNGYTILDSNLYYSAVRNISGGLRVVF